MKVVLLHGPAKAASRKKLIEIKQKFDPNNILVFDEVSTSYDIADNLMSMSLFTTERLMVLENLEDINLPPITNDQLPTTLILWFDQEISEKKSIMQWVKENGGQIFYFPEGREVSVFPFLDHLANGDRKAFIELDRLKKGGFDIYYIITMTFYLLRNLVLPPKNTPSFVRDKLARQRKNLSIEKIKNLYKDMLDLDFKIKGSAILSQQAEFVLVNKFME